MENYLNIKNKVIVISGAAGFLANKLIVEFLRNGAEVYGIDNDHKQLLSQYKKIKKIYPTNKFHVIKCDITKESEVKKNIKNILKLSKNIDVLINNAATKTKNLKNFFNPFEKYRLKDWNEVMNVNINGAFLISKEVSKFMIKRKSGNIISVASIQGVVVNDKRLYKGSKFRGIQMGSPAVYSTSKSALIGLTRYLATYLGEYNIRANSISPGGIRSEQNKKFLKNYSKKVPLNRMGLTKEIVDTILFLSSEKSNYITGQNLIVDGGYTSW